MNPDTKMWVKLSLGEVTFGSIIRLDCPLEGERYFLFCDMNCVIPLNVMSKRWIFHPLPPDYKFNTNMLVEIYNLGGESVNDGDDPGVSSSILGFIRDVLGNKEYLNES